MNKICIHKENGIVFALIDGHELKNVVDYKIKSSAHEKTELTLVINAEIVQSEFEAYLVEN